MSTLEVLTLCNVFISLIGLFVQIANNNKK